MRELDVYNMCPVCVQNKRKKKVKGIIFLSICYLVAINYVD